MTKKEKKFLLISIAIIFIVTILIKGSLSYYYKDKANNIKIQTQNALDKEKQKQLDIFKSLTPKN